MILKNPSCISTYGPTKHPHHSTSMPPVAFSGFLDPTGGTVARLLLACRRIVDQGLALYAGCCTIAGILFASRALSSARCTARLGFRPHICLRRACSDMVLPLPSPIFPRSSPFFLTTVGFGCCPSLFLVGGGEGGAASPITSESAVDRCPRSPPARCCFALRFSRRTWERE
jgi:hypothetical protein